MRAHSQDRSVTHPDLVAHTAPRLLTWYRAEHRKLPWRAAPGALADPYRVWLSEVMLQQTTVKVAAPYFERFTARWPTVADLAAAPRDDVMAAWAGLGYYARAANLHACAQRVAQDFGGRFPETEAQLVTLPGIGPYTAAAIAAMAFGAPATPVDGNIERVMSRLFARMDPLPGVKPVVTADARALTPERQTVDPKHSWTWGRRSARPKNRLASSAPSKVCAGRAPRGSPTDFRAAVPSRPSRSAAVLRSSRCAKTGACCSAVGRQQVCSPTCWKSHQPPGSPAAGRSMQR
ncbi:MAG: A/G-specific adenine glycosylase [Pseudomonadota bacterium]